MKEKKDGGVRESLFSTMKVTWSTMQGAVDLLPGAVLSFFFVVIVLAAVCVWSRQLMMSVTAMLVIFIATIVYTRTGSYGEASLALVAGLLASLTANWTPERFVLFLFAWFGFSALALIIGSVKLAAKVEEIYVDASVSVDNIDSKSVEKDLRKIGKQSGRGFLGPIERAEVIRFLVFRKVPLELLGKSLDSIETVSVATKVPTMKVASFISDIYRISVERGGSYVQMVDSIYNNIRESPVSPLEFIDAFTASRRFVLSGKLPTRSFFSELRKALSAGISPSGVEKYFEKQFG